MTTTKFKFWCKTCINREIESVCNDCGPDMWVSE